MTSNQVMEKLVERFGNDVQDPVQFRGEQSVTVRRERLVEACRLLKTECAFEMLTDISGVDNYSEAPRYEVDYLLYSFTHKIWFRLKVRLAEEDATVETVSTVWRAANWHERETFDMFGIRFTGHPNLKRILMWDGYPFHPLRKDFPLAGLPTALPETAVDAGIAEIAPMLGGPFAPGMGKPSSIDREPRQFDTRAETTDKQANPSKQEPV